MKSFSVLLEENDLFVILKTPVNQENTLISLIIHSNTRWCLFPQLGTIEVTEVKWFHATLANN